MKTEKNLTMSAVSGVLLIMLANHNIGASESLLVTPSSVIGRSLFDFYEAAIDFSPQLKIAEEGLNIGRAREEQAQGQLQPQLNANANLTDNSRISFSQFGQK